MASGLVMSDVTADWRNKSHVAAWGVLMHNHE